MLGAVILIITSVNSISDTVTILFSNRRADAIGFFRYFTTADDEDSQCFRNASLVVSIFAHL